jgi:hypothetical protein
MVFPCGGGDGVSARCALGCGRAGFGFSIEDKYNTSEFADSYWEPININTR